MRALAIRPIGLMGLLSIAVTISPCNGRAVSHVFSWDYNSSTPATNVLTEFDGAVQISAGAAFNLGLDATGFLKAQSPYRPIVLPPGLSNVISAAASPLFYELPGYSLALKGDGKVVSLGYNSSWRGYDFRSPPPAGLSNVVAISPGEEHALALKRDGTVIAWGANGFGETNVPVDLKNVIAIAAGAYYSLALRADGKVIAWGGYENKAVNIPPGLSNVVAIAAGYYHALALKADGRVTAWGNTYGQLDVPPDWSNVVSIASGGGDLALKLDGTVVGWGFNAGRSVSTPTALTNITGISSGPSRSLALLSDGPPFVTSALNDLTPPYGSTVWLRVEATGSWPLSYQWNFNGAPLLNQTNQVLGLANMQFNQSGLYSVIISNTAGTVTNSGLINVLPALITIQPANTFAYASTTFTLFVGALGSDLSYQWQFNGNDLPGQTNANLRLTSIRLDQAGSYNVVVHSAGGTIISSNAVVTVSPLGITRHPQSQYVPKWATATFYASALGIAPLNYQWKFNGTDLPGQTRSTLALSNLQVNQAGMYALRVTNAYADLTSDSAFLSVGEVAVLGTPLVDPASLPTNLTNLIAVASGMALKADGTIIAWGQPGIPSGLTNIIAIADGVALKADGTVISWKHAGTPQDLTNIVALAAAPYHVLALRANGMVVAWGDDWGMSSLDLSNVVAIAAGSSHFLVLESSGEVVAWGDPSSGAGNVPSGLVNCIAIASGSFQSFALRANGTVVAWGNNLRGATTVPSGLTDVASIGGGDYHGMAVKANGMVTGWGSYCCVLDDFYVRPDLRNIFAFAKDFSDLALIGDGPPMLHGPLLQPTISDSGFRVSLPSRSGKVYRLEYKSSLTDTNWIPLPLVAGNGRLLNLVDPNSADVSRFYRVRSW